jgi:GTPase
MRGKRSGSGPTVVLVGRPNVGKSTLFNRIAGSRRAIVTPMPGTTRDVLAQPAEWLGTSFTLVDTGGLFGASADPLHELVVLHGQRAIDAADVLVFVVDGRDGLVSGDLEISKTVRAAGVPVILAVNKIDDKRARLEEFHQLGFEPVVGIAAEHGQGVGDLLDEVILRLIGKRGPSAGSGAGAGASASGARAKSVEGRVGGAQAGETEGNEGETGDGDADPDVGGAAAKPARAKKSGASLKSHLMTGSAETGTAVHPTEASRRGDAPVGEISVAIVGRPNVGKSSLVNRLLKEERVMVSDLPGTTRDPIDTLLRWHGRDLRIVDTAGIRRAGKVARSAQVEAVSVVLARRAIERADVAVLLIDSVEGATDQDAAIVGEAERAGCGIIIAANKWDLMKGRGVDFSKTFDDELRRRLKFLDYAPVLHISAATGERTPKLLEAIERVANARQRRVPTGELNRFVEAVTGVHPPVSPGTRAVRVLYASQTAVAPPTFVLFTNVATTFHFSYERFLTNRLRDAFGFVGTPIRLHVRRRARKGEND